MRAEQHNEPVYRGRFAGAEAPRAEEGKGLSRSSKDGPFMGSELQTGHWLSRADKAASAYMCKLRDCEPQLGIDM